MRDAFTISSEAEGRLRPCEIARPPNGRNQSPPASVSGLVSPKQERRSFSSRIASISLLERPFTLAKTGDHHAIHGHIA